MNTKPVRIHPEDLDLLRDLAGERWKNRKITLEKTMPTPARLIKLALRQPDLKLKLAKLPANEDIVR